MTEELLRSKKVAARLTKGQTKLILTQLSHDDIKKLNKANNEVSIAACRLRRDD